MRIFFPILIIIVFFGTSATLAQEQNHVPNQFLVQLHTQQNIQQIHEKLNRNYPSIQWIEPHRLIPNMNYWLLEYKGNEDDAQILEFLKKSSCIQIAKYNHKVTLRSPNNTIPNDASYASQWQYKNIGAAIGGT